MIDILAEPELFRGYNPKVEVLNQAIELVHDLEPIEVAEAKAATYKYQHGDRCDMWAGQSVEFRKGACILYLHSYCRWTDSHLPGMACRLLWNESLTRLLPIAHVGRATL